MHVGFLVYIFHTTYKQLHVSTRSICSPAGGYMLLQYLGFLGSMVRKSLGKSEFLLQRSCAPRTETAKSNSRCSRLPGCLPLFLEGIKAHIREVCVQLCPDLTRSSNPIARDNAVDNSNCHFPTYLFIPLPTYYITYLKVPTHLLPNCIRFPSLPLTSGRVSLFSRLTATCDIPPWSLLSLRLLLLTFAS